MALRKRRVIRADLSAMPPLEQQFAVMWTRADQLKPGHYFDHPGRQGIVVKTEQNEDDEYLIVYYDMDGRLSYWNVDAYHMISCEPWPAERGGNKAMLAYQLHTEGYQATGNIIAPLPATQAPAPAPLSPSGLPMPPISIRAESLRIGDRIRLVPNNGDVFRITDINNIIGLGGEDCYQLRVRNETTGDILNRFRDRGSMVEVVEQCSPQEFYVGMGITIDGVLGKISSVSQTESALRVRIRWVSDYIPGSGSTSAEFEVTGVIGNAP
jgi:hypothetical protein